MIDKNFNLEQYIRHHVLDGHQWHLPFLPAIHLPPYLSLHALMLLLGSGFLIILFCILYQKKSRVPHGITNVLEVFVVFIRDEISIACLGEKDGKKMAPLFCTFFFFILMLNLMGMIPVFAGATANVNVTAGLATVTLGFMIFGTIVKNGVGGFFKALYPSGLFPPLAVFIFLLEFIGLFIKTLALTIRLFANMLSGHIVIICLLGLIILMGYGALPAIALAIFISLLEVLVVFLQAYIFTLLSAMFIGQMYHPHH